jgi:hypothetical protein
MKFFSKDPPRKFKVGRPENKIVISDFGDLFLGANEQVTLVSEDGMRHDFAAKDWGFYSTPSINGRLKDEGFKTALVENQKGQIYIMSVDKDKINLFEKYCLEEQQTVLEWLDERKLKID